MASAKEIQSRIKSIQDTMKITNAMYMISSSKMKKAKQILADTEPYFYALQSAISRVLRHVPDIEHKYFNERPEIKPEERKIGYIVVSADKGLAGAYNHNIFKLAEEQIAKNPHTQLFVLGEVEEDILPRSIWMWTPLSAIRCRNQPDTGQGSLQKK